MATDENGRKIRLGLLAVVASSILFSCKSVFFKMCFQYGTDPVVLQTMRSAFSAPFFVWPLLAHLFRSGGSASAPFGGTTRSFPSGGTASVPLGRRDLAAIAGLGFVGYYLASIFDMIGLQYVSAGTERLVLYVYPTLVVLFSAWIFRKRVPRSLYWPLALSYGGIALSFGGEAAGPAGGRPYLGGFLVLLSAVFYALFLVGQGKMIQRVGPQRLVAGCMMVSCAAVFAHFALVFPLSALAQPAPVYWIAGLTSIFCTVVPVYLYGYGVNAVGAGKAAVVSSVGPVSTLVLAGGLLGERANPWQWMGLGLVMAGSLKLGLGGGKAKPAPDQAASAAAAGSAAARRGRM